MACTDTGSHTWEVKIDGTDYVSKVTAMQWTEADSGRVHSADITLTDDGYSFSAWDEVTITSDVGTGSEEVQFGGYVARPEPERDGPTTEKRWRIRCVGYNERLRRLVLTGKHYTGETVSAIITDILSNADASDFSVSAPTTTLNEFTVQRGESFAKTMDRLALLAGDLEWGVGQTKHVWMKSATSTAAPWAVTDSGAANCTTVMPVLDGTMSAKRTSEHIFNRIRVEGGYAPSDIQTETKTADTLDTNDDGDWIFNLAHTDITDFVSVKIDGTEYFGTSSWGWDWYSTGAGITVFGHKTPGTVRFANSLGLTTETIVIKYRYRSQIVVTKTNATLYASMGFYLDGKPVQDRAIGSEEMANDYAQAMLDANDSEKITGNFSVAKLGLHAGNSITISSTPLNLSGAYFIRKVETTVDETNNVIQSVQFGDMPETLGSVVRGSGNSDPEGITSTPYGTGQQPAQMEGEAGTLRLLDNLRVGAEVTGYMVGNGIWQGLDSGVAKMHIGDPAGDNLHYDGVDLTVTGLFSGGTDMSSTQADDWLINSDRNTSSSSLTLGASGGDAVFSWDGTDVKLDSPFVIDVTDAEAFLVRKASDGGDVFAVDTSTGKVSVTGNILLTGNIGTEEGSYNSIVGSAFGSKSGYTYNNIVGKNIGDAATGGVYRNTITGYNVANAATSVGYNTITGYNVANVITGNVQYNLLNGYNLLSAAKSGASFNTVNGKTIASAATGYVLYNFISGQTIANSATVDVRYNFMTGYNLANSSTGTVENNVIIGNHLLDSATGDVKRNIIVGPSIATAITGHAQDVFSVGYYNLYGTTNVTGIDRVIALPYEALRESSASDLDDAIAIGYRAGYKNAYDHPALFGREASASANNQMVLGSSFYSGGIKFGNKIASDLTPLDTDTYDLGSSTKLWRKGWLSELESILFVENSVQVTGGWWMVPHQSGTLAGDVDTSQTTIDFGSAVTENDFILMRGNLSVEYIQVGTLVSGTTYNVTRDLDGTGANSWPQGQVWVNLGYNGDGRIEFDAQTGGPRISVFRQGTSYNSQTEYVRIGDLEDTYGYSSETYGVGIGAYGDADYMTVDAIDGIRFFDSGNVQRAQLASGEWTLGATASEHVKITSSAVQILDGSIVYTDLSAGTLTLGDTSGGEYVTVASGGISLYGNATERTHIDSDGSGWLAGDGKLNWDTSGNITMTGTITTSDITADGGTIGGWIIESGWMKSSSAHEIYLNASGKRITIGYTTFGTQGIQLDYNSGSPRFYAGDGSNYYFNFDGTNLSWKGKYTSLSTSGAFVASNATITGKITSSSGKIGGWELGSSTLTSTSGYLVIDSANDKIKYGNVTLSVANGIESGGAIGSYLPVHIPTYMYSDLYVMNSGGSSTFLHVNSSEVKIATALKHTGSTAGFFGVTPVSRPSAYSFSNGTADRSIDCDSTTLDELADVVYTMWSDLKSLGLLQ